MEFKKYKKYIWTGFVILFIIIAIFVIGRYYFDLGYDKLKYEEVGFELDTLFLRVTLSENQTTIRHIKLNENVGDFSIKINELSELLSISKESSKLVEEGKHDIEVIFNSKGKEPGVYLGELEFSFQEIVKKVPIIFEIQSKIVIFDANLNLYPQGRDVIPGQRLNANIKIFDLANFETSQVKVIYFLKSFDGRTIISETEDIIIDDDKYEYSKSLDIPKNIRLGNYVLVTIVKYTDRLGDSSVGTSSVYFSVVEEGAEGAEGLTEKTLIYILIMFGFFFLIFLGLFIYSLFFRDKMLKEMDKQYKTELNKQRKMIECQGGKDYSKLKTSVEKREYKKELEKIKKLRFGALKKTKDEKIKVFKSIKKKFKGSKRKTQLRAWKKKGYDTSVLEKKYKMPNVNNIKSKVRIWKRKGYDTSILEGK